MGMTGACICDVPRKSAGYRRWRGVEISRQKRGFRIIVGRSKTALTDLHRTTESPSHNVQAVRARIRARVQRLCDDERGFGRREKIWGQVYFGAHGGSRARLPEPAKD